MWRMSISLQVVIALVSVSWSAGLFFGVLAVRFVSKRECQRTTGQIWDAIDGIQNVMMGGKTTFELRAVRPHGAPKIN